MWKARPHELPLSAEKEAEVRRMKVKVEEKKVRKFSHGKIYEFATEYEINEPWHGVVGTIPKGVKVRFEYPNLGYATFTFVDETLHLIDEPLRSNLLRSCLRLSLKPETAFKILKEACDEGRGR